MLLNIMVKALLLSLDALPLFEFSHFHQTKIDTVARKHEKQNRFIKMIKLKKTSYTIHPISHFNPIKTQCLNTEINMEI